MAKNCTDYEGEMEVIYTKGNDGKYKELYVVFTYMYYSYMQLKSIEHYLHGQVFYVDWSVLTK